MSGVYSLNLIDTLNHSSIDYCLPRGDPYSTLQPVWSPDSRFIAIPMRDYSGDYWLSRWQTIIVDIKNNRAYKFMDNVVPVGWMVEP